MQDVNATHNAVAVAFFKQVLRPIRPAGGVDWRRQLTRRVFQVILENKQFLQVVFLRHKFKNFDSRMSLRLEQLAKGCAAIARKTRDRKMKNRSRLYTRPPYRRGNLSSQRKRPRCERKHGTSNGNAYI